MRSLFVAMCLCLAAATAIVIYGSLGEPVTARPIECGTWGVMLVRGGINLYHNHRIIGSTAIESLSVPFVIAVLVCVLIAYRQEQRKRRGFPIITSKGNPP